MAHLFDLNPTTDELAALFLSPLTREEYDRTASGNPDDEYAAQYRLLMMRGDQAAAEQALAKIKSPEAAEQVSYCDALV